MVSNISSRRLVKLQGNTTGSGLLLLREFSVGVVVVGRYLRTLAARSRLQAQREQSKADANGGVVLGRSVAV